MGTIMSFGSCWTRDTSIDDCSGSQSPSLMERCDRNQSLSVLQNKSAKQRLNEKQALASRTRISLFTQMMNQRGRSSSSSAVNAKKSVSYKVPLSVNSNVSMLTSSTNKPGGSRQSKSSGLLPDTPKSQKLRRISKPPADSVKMVPLIALNSLSKVSGKQHLHHTKRKKSINQSIKLNCSSHNLAMLQSNSQNSTNSSSNKNSPSKNMKITTDTKNKDENENQSAFNSKQDLMTVSNETWSSLSNSNSSLACCAARTRLQFKSFSSLLSQTSSQKALWQNMCSRDNSSSKDTQHDSSNSINRKKVKESLATTATTTQISSFYRSKKARSWYSAGRRRPTCSIFQSFRKKQVYENGQKPKHGTLNSVKVHDMQEFVSSKASDTSEATSKTASARIRPSLSTQRMSWTGSARVSCSASPRSSCEGVSTTKPSPRKSFLLESMLPKFRSNESMACKSFNNSTVWSRSATSRDSTNSKSSDADEKTGEI